MLRHDDIWRALDRLAMEQGLTPSGLARRAGLDPTTFNRSKRVTREGKLRWPSTESVSKVLDVTRCPLDHLVDLVNGKPAGDVLRDLPILPLDRLSAASFDAIGRTTGPEWQVERLPDIGDPIAFALRVVDDGFRPIYRSGDVLVLSPGAGVAIGNRVFARPVGGGIGLFEVLRDRIGGFDLMPLAAALRDQVVPCAAGLTARVVWVSQ